MYHRGRGEHKYHAIKQRKNTINQHNHKLFGLGFMETIPSPRLGFLRGVFLANHSASTDNLTRTTKRQNTYQRKLKIHKRGPNKQRYNKSILRYKTQTRPGLVALYDQAWTGHCAMAQAPPSTNTGAPWPLRNLLTCALRRKILLSLWPLACAPGRDDY